MARFAFGSPDATHPAGAAFASANDFAGFGEASRRADSLQPWSGPIDAR
jgi:hypothetical protein